MTQERGWEIEPESENMSLNTAISVGMSGVSPRWNVKNGSAECQQRDRVSVYTGISRGGASVNTIITVIASWHVQTRDTGITLCDTSDDIYIDYFYNDSVTGAWRSSGQGQGLFIYPGSKYLTLGCEHLSSGLLFLSDSITFYQDCQGRYHHRDADSGVWREVQVTLYSTWLA